LKPLNLSQNDEAILASIASETLLATEIFFSFSPHHQNPKTNYVYKHPKTDSVAEVTKRVNEQFVPLITTFCSSAINLSRSGPLTNVVDTFELGDSRLLHFRTKGIVL